MARFISIPRRAAFVFIAIFFTLLIRIVSLSHRVSFSLGHSPREGRCAFVQSDKGPFKQIALGIHPPSASASYLLRIANFYPFVKLENIGLGLYKGERALLGDDVVYAQSCDCDDCDDCDCGDCDDCDE